MANVPYPISGETLEEVRYQIYELIRTLFEEKIGGADLGDVFSIVGDVFTLVLASASGLTKSGNVLAIDPYSTGGLSISTNGIAIKVNADGGLETDASGAGILLDGATLTLSSSGLKMTAGPVPGLHAAEHENAGTDEISVSDLSGLLADDQHVLDTEVEAVITAEIVNGQSIDNAIDALIATHAAIANAHHSILEIQVFS